MPCVFRTSPLLLAWIGKYNVPTMLLYFRFRFVSFYSLLFLLVFTLTPVCFMVLSFNDYALGFTHILKDVPLSCEIEDDAETIRSMSASWWCALVHTPHISYLARMAL